MVAFNLKNFYKKKQKFKMRIFDVNSVLVIVESYQKHWFLSEFLLILMPTEVGIASHREQTISWFYQYSMYELMSKSSHTSSEFTYRIFARNKELRNIYS
jgi:hypothetical protein